MDAEISPEPSPEERAAVEDALDRLAEPLPPHVAALYGSPWRRAGFQENAGDDQATLE